MENVRTIAYGTDSIRPVLAKQAEHLQKMRSILSGGLKGKKLSDFQRQLSEQLEALEASEHQIWAMTCPPDGNHFAAYQRMTMNHE